MVGCLVSLTAVLTLSRTSTAEEGPAPAKAQTEHAEVTLKQVETTLSPKDGNLAECESIAPETFEASLPNGERLPIVHVDRAGVPIDAVSSADLPAAQRRGPIYIGFYFDLDQLGICPKLDVGDSVVKRAFDSVNAMLVSREMTEHWDETLGDRLMLMSFDGDSPTFETGWVGKKAFTSALDTLKNRPFNKREHVHENARHQALVTLSIALSNQAETAGSTKHIFYLSADLQLDADTGEATLGNIATAVGAARIELNTIDLLSDKRVLPYGLGTLAWLGQGKLYGNGKTATNAVEDVIGTYEHGCRVIVSIDLKRHPEITEETRLDLKVVDKRFTIPPRAPIGKAPKITDDARFAALIRARFWGRGVRLESLFWPIKAIDQKTWKGLLLVRVRTEPGEQLPEGTDQLDVFVSVNDGRMPLYKSLDGTDIAEIRTRGSRLLVFELAARRGGGTSFASVATTDLSAGATSRTVFTVPKPPKPGQSTAWAVVGGEGAYGSTAILLPSFDATAPSGQPTGFMGYGCASKSGAPVAEVVNQADQAVDSVALVSTNRDACGWFVGSTTKNLDPGAYYFRVPVALQLTSSEPMRFKVVDAATASVVTPR